MAKKKQIEPVKRIKIYSPEYVGFVDEMPEEIKTVIEARLKKK